MRNYVLLLVVTLIFIVAIWLTNNDVPVISGKLPAPTEFDIKKSEMAINSADARPSRFVGAERIDAAIAELDIDKRKASLSIKLLEELKNKEAVSKFSSPLSGKNLPFSSLSDKLEKKQKKKEKK